MTETTLDSLVVKIRGDSSDLTRQLENIERDFGALDSIAEKTMDSMGRIFQDFARSGELSFNSLKRVALSALSDIANSAIRSGLDAIFGGNNNSGGGAGGGIGNGIGNFLGNMIGNVLFGRASGGTVGRRQPYLVGERGPELFVPDSAGRIIPDIPAGSPSQITGKSSNITINITNQGAADNMTQRSAAQVAVAVRRAMARAERDL